MACGKPECNNNNPTFNRLNPSELEYKTELINLIQSDSISFKYWLMGYEKQNEKEYLQIEAIADSICAKAKILVKDWSKMEGIQKTKAGAYHGADLVGLQFKLNPISEEFEYLDIEEIIDYD